LAAVTPGPRRAGRPGRAGRGHAASRLRRLNAFATWFHPVRPVSSVCAGWRCSCYPWKAASSAPGRCRLAADRVLPGTGQRGGPHPGTGRDTQRRHAGAAAATMIWIKLRVQWISRSSSSSPAAAHDPGHRAVVGLALYNRIQHDACRPGTVLGVTDPVVAYAYPGPGPSGAWTRSTPSTLRRLPGAWARAGSGDVPVIAPTMGPPQMPILNSVLLTGGPRAGRVHHRLPAALRHAGSRPCTPSPNTPNAVVIFSTSMASLRFAFALL